MSDATRILVVDDDPKIRAVVRRGLAYEGYRVVEAGSGEEGLEKAREHLPDLVVLDIMLPGIDGLEVTRRLRAAGDPVAILMLTARDEVGDRVEGLETGADDYLVKPFSFEELLARVHALLRRSTTPPGEVLRFADLELDVDAREGRRGERLIELTTTEFNLLLLFNAAPAQGPDSGHHHGARLGLRLRGRVERAGGLHPLPARQARGRRRTAADPYRPRRGLRAEGVIAVPGPPSIRTRLVLIYTGLLAGALLVFGVGVYLVLHVQLDRTFDADLAANAHHAAGAFAQDVNAQGQLRPPARLVAELAATGGRVVVLAPDGTVLADSASGAPPLPITSSDLATARSGTHPAVRELTVDGIRRRLAMEAIRSPAGLLLGYVAWAQSTASIHDLLRTVALALVLVGSCLPASPSSAAWSWPDGRWRRLQR